MKAILKSISGFIFFGLTVLAVIASLKLANWIPSAVQGGFVREYGSIEEVSSKLKIRDIFIPSYFPQRFKWPPSVILAQTRPYAAIMMEFKDVKSGDTGLVIAQIKTGAHFVSDDIIAMPQIRREISYPLNGRRALVEVGVGNNDEPRSRLSWTEGRYRITVSMKSSPFELIKIAESMQPQ